MTDYQALTRRVTHFIDLLESHHQPQATVALDDVIQALEPVTMIAEQLRPDLAAGLEPRGFNRTAWQAVLLTATRLRAWLQEAEAVQREIGPRGPQVAAADLHPRVWSVAAQHWDAGHHDVAVREAARAIDLQLRERVGRTDQDGTALAEAVFAPSEPRPDQPRLRLPADALSDTSINNQQRGAASFAKGCFLAIRNTFVHDDVPAGAQDCLERLAALSVLARWIEQAELVTVDDATRT